jgi:hypothetical protein
MSIQTVVLMALAAGGVAGWLVRWRPRRLVALAVVGGVSLAAYFFWLAAAQDSPFENDEDGDLARTIAAIVCGFIWAGWCVGLAVGGLLRRRSTR